MRSERSKREIKGEDSEFLIEVPKLIHKAPCECKNRESVKFGNHLANLMSTTNRLIFLLRFFPLLQNQSLKKSLTEFNAEIASMQLFVHLINRKFSTHTHTHQNAINSYNRNNNNIVK